MKKQKEIPLILRKYSTKSEEKLQQKYMKIKKLYKYTYLCSANMTALLLYLFSFITSNFIPGAYMGKWQYTRSKYFTMVAIFSAFILVFLSLIIAIIYYFKANNNSISWYHVKSLIKTFYKKKESEVIDSNLEDVKTSLHRGVAALKAGDIIDNDLLSKAGSLEQALAIGEFANSFHKQAKIIEKEFVIKGFDKFIVRLPIIISLLYMIIMIVVGINLTNADKKEILSGRYKMISTVLSIYKDRDAKVENEYNFDLVNKTYDNDDATIVMDNGDEIDLDMTNSPKVSDDIKYIVNYKKVLENDLNNIINDFANRTTTLQSRASSFKKYVEDPIQTEGLISFNDVQKQEIVSEIISSFQEKSDVASYKIIQKMANKAYYQVTYIKIYYEADGTYSFRFTTTIYD